MRRLLLVGFVPLVALAGLTSSADPAAGPARVELRERQAEGRLEVVVGGKTAAVYRHGGVDLPHFFPVLSPSGKELTIDRAEPFPHHRSLWFADTVALRGRRQASFYNAWYMRIDKNDPQSPFRDRVRHLAFADRKAKGNEATYRERLVWEMDQKVPVLDEDRQVRVVALDRGQYFLDLRFTLTAAHGDVQFTSDQAHYAWPYVRMHPQFSVDRGGTLVNSEGEVNQKGTNNRRASWVDYSNRVGGATEGLAIFTDASTGPAPLWLTRNYGTFGPRREGARHGKPFDLKKGESIRQRVGILIHTGDAKAADVEGRYRQYRAGKL